MESFYSQMEPFIAQIRSATVVGNRSGFSFEIETIEIGMYGCRQEAWQPERLLV